MLLFVFLAWPGFQAAVLHTERVDFAKDSRPMLERSC
jgi:hypothetical protein